MILALLLALAGPPKAGLTLHVLGHTGRQVIAHVPFQLTVWARLEDPRKEWRCPSFEWDFGDGARSGREDLSCDPYARDEKHPSFYRSGQIRHTYRVGGEHELQVTVRALGRQRRASVTVTARGFRLGDVE